MLIVPSVDILGGKVVRLMKGRPELSKVYADDPVSKAEFWVGEGATLLHVVDLDGALGTGNNTDCLLRIASRVKVPVQCGGGIRTITKARSLLDSGVYRVVLGTLAFQSPELVRDLVGQYGEDRIMVALDYIGSQVMFRGWLQSSGLEVEQALGKFRRCDVSNFLLTSIERDGLLQGPDYEGIRRNCRMQGVNVFASGGFRDLDDVRQFRETGIGGIVIGKALYEGLFTLGEAVKAVESGP